MKITVFEHKQNENINLIKFILEGVGIELANAFRRIILTEVPTMAISEVLFIENDSVLFDEMIAHRLGLVPLSSDLKNYNLPDECSCGGEGCTLCQASFSCDVHADSETIVYARDLICDDPKIHPVQPNLIIAKLGASTSLVFEAYAQLGKGFEHAKYQPVSTIGYKYFPSITLNDSLITTEEEIQEVIKHCHKKCYRNESGKLVLNEDYWINCSLCNACVKNSPIGAIKVESIPNKFIFSMEATGQLPLKEIMEKAVEIFLEKLDEFDEELKKIKIVEKAAVI